MQDLNETERTEITESTEITENTEITQDNGRQEQAPGNADIPCHAIKTLDEATQFALSDSHIAWEIIFRFCRALKSMPQYTVRTRCSTLDHCNDLVLLQDSEFTMSFHLVHIQQFTSSTHT